MGNSFVNFFLNLEPAVEEEIQLWWSFGLLSKTVVQFY